LRIFDIFSISFKARGTSKSDCDDFEFEFEVEQSKFAFSPGQIRKPSNPTRLGALRRLKGIEKGLKTGRSYRIDDASFDHTAV
jgi:hypothetical protein